MRTWKYVLAPGVAASLVGSVALASALMPTRAPERSARDVYGGLFEHRAVRADVRTEASAPPVFADTTDPTVTPVPEIAPSPVERLRISRIGVDAPLIALSFAPDGSMDTPKQPQVVAWYDFTGKPGLGGNAVFSGHVDWKDYGAAVFWNLKKLTPGDRIEVKLRGGTVVQYDVTAAQSYEVADLRMEEILAPTVAESLTLITCGGQFSNGEYTHRLVVRGVRVGIARE